MRLARSEKYGQNLQLEEKYTQTSFIEDVESEVLGMYLAGYCGNFGVRYDETGWTDRSSDDKPLSTKDQYRQITGMPIHAERMIMNGATIIDGPELVWADDFGESWGGVKDSEGYTCRNWYTRDQYVNSTLNFFEKIVDGTYRIPTRQEVIDRTQYVVIQDVNSGNDHQKYSTYETLFEGLYRMPGDGNLWDNKSLTTLVTDTFMVNGCKSKPTYTAKDTGRNQTKSVISESYSNGTYTLTVKHNGPVDLSIKCSGNNTNRKTNVNKATVQPITQPSFYTGTRQYEGEFFDVKNCEGYVTNACGSGVTGIWGQGFLKFGKNANACAKDTVTTRKAGEFTMKLRYSSTSEINNVDLYVNGSKVETMKLSNTNGYSNWKLYEKKITLKQGDNKIKFKANSALPSSLYIDCFTVDGTFGDGSATPVINDELNGTLIKELKVTDDENKADWSIYNDFGSGSTIFGDREFTAVDVPAKLNGAEAIRTACDSKMATTDLGTFTAAKDITVYTAVDSRNTDSLPAWLSGWTKTDDVITTSNGLTMVVYKKNFSSGSNVTLGMNGGNGNCVNYIVLVTEKEFEPLNGKLIKNLQINNRENGADWSIYYDLKDGAKLYGDRDLTVSGVPSYLVNAETIRTACDSKLFTSDLATFTAGADITVYAAVDTRVNSRLDWLRSWTAVGTSLTTSNGVTLALYKLDVKSGAKVTLGTNGGENESANYIVMAVARQATSASAPVITGADYSEQYHQIRFTWSPVSGATNYGIAVYLAGKWRIQTQSIPASTTSYTTPKNLTPGKTYKVAIAAKVNGEWTAAEAIKNAVTVTVK